ncbi:hypothetical protein F5Y00DRAFT_262074 [Daldinia vernicosa]|uniref:uncharacterized protein n=1 Tax=Daldinia vernicosa TaxID=114800 RepID=UPI0020074B48|nr:uncharacterized protein F5Y00DRAFT_262074 [Daldinia vernicosa]KAI0848918.1 hypothetical protein F5Y00DRAFT_262074 [Daldinia vernicosa]
MSPRYKPQRMAGWLAGLVTGCFTKAFLIPTKSAPPAWLVALNPGRPSQDGGFLRAAQDGNLPESSFLFFLPRAARRSMQRALVGWTDRQTEERLRRTSDPAYPNSKGGIHRTSAELERRFPVAGDC